MDKEEFEKIEIGDLIEGYMVLRNLEKALKEMLEKTQKEHYKDMAAGFLDVISEARAAYKRLNAEDSE